jgi:hypothetical protein
MGPHKERTAVEVRGVVLSSAAGYDGHDCGRGVERGAQHSETHGRARAHGTEGRGNEWWWAEAHEL